MPPPSATTPGPHPGTPVPIPDTTVSSTPGPQPQSPTTSTYHHNPLSHISFGVSSYSRSKQFYDAVLAPLGLHLVFDSESARTAAPNKSSSSFLEENETRTLGYGPDAENEIINIFEIDRQGKDGTDGNGTNEKARPPGPGFHLALNAPTRLAVVEFHAAAVANGGVDNGLPGLRKHYGRDYFAAYVVDPDGHRLEVVCKRRMGEDEVSEEGEGADGTNWEEGKGKGMGEVAQEEAAKEVSERRSKGGSEGEVKVEVKGESKGGGKGLLKRVLKGVWKGQSRIESMRGSDGEIRDWNGNREEELEEREAEEERREKAEDRREEEEDRREEAEDRREEKEAIREEKETRREKKEDRREEEFGKILDRTVVIDDKGTEIPVIKLE